MDREKREIHSVLAAISLQDAIPFATRRGLKFLNHENSHRTDAITGSSSD
jgi:hypothetical protein